MLKDRTPLPLIIVCAFALLAIITGMFDWVYSFDINVFREMHQSIMEVNINGFPIISNLIDQLIHLEIGQSMI